MHDEQDAHDYYQPLFDHMVEDHDMILSTTEMDEIIIIVKEMIKNN